ncbi:hypothetical protein [Granulosicoccus antarcticus]|uniref:hypothetical protein n=1 Tax=Granulosicoccus antarcticus TaxID=437505 RepID=UPI0012FE6058|nr:hypothetical protein [Granulosicoccus antarcticus]
MKYHSFEASLVLSLGLTITACSPAEGSIASPPETDANALSEAPLKPVLFGMP